jgi:hypothetical protein
MQANDDNTGSNSITAGSGVKLSAEAVFGIAIGALIVAFLIGYVIRVAKTKGKESQSHQSIGTASLHDNLNANNVDAYYDRRTMNSFVENPIIVDKKNSNSRGKASDKSSASLELSAKHANDDL